MWKGYRILLLTIVIGIALTETVQAAFDSTPGFVYKVSTGILTQVNDVEYKSWTVFPANNTIHFDLSDQFLHVIIFTVVSFGNGTLTITLLGPQPIILRGTPKTSAYIRGQEVITYTTLFTDPLLILGYTQGISKESQTVLFRDDFLYTNPLAESSWTIDQYQSPGVNSGEYTSSGYLVMKALSTNAVEAVHVTNAMFQKSSYSINGTTIKRKMTVALIPFAKTESPQTASVKTGFAPLLTSGAYPSNTPYNTPSLDAGGICGGVNPIGTDYAGFDNSG